MNYDFPRKDYACCYDCCADDDDGDGDAAAVAVAAVVAAVAAAAVVVAVVAVVAAAAVDDEANGDVTRSVGLSDESSSRLPKVALLACLRSRDLLENLPSDSRSSYYFPAVPPLKKRNQINRFLSFVKDKRKSCCSECSQKLSIFAIIKYRNINTIVFVK